MGLMDKKLVLFVLNSCDYHGVCSVDGVCSTSFACVIFATCILALNYAACFCVLVKSVVVLDFFGLFG